jgi:hypothetical protein
MEWIKTHDGAGRLDKLLAMGERESRARAMPMALAQLLF